MIRKGIRSLLHRNLNPFATQLNKPILYGNNKSIISVSQWWNGSLPRPNDYYVEDTLETEICEDWSLSKGIFRVVFSACLNDPSMNININHLKRSFFLNQLIQLSGSEKQMMVDNPSVVIIKPVFSQEFHPNDQQIPKNMLELDKLFESGVGLKIAYLIDWKSLSKPAYLKAITKRSKAVSADVVLSKVKLADVVFQHGHKLEHVFYSSPYGREVCTTDLEQMMQAMLAIDFKGKLVLSAGEKFESDFKVFQTAALKKGFAPRLQYSLETDGWYTMI